MRLFFSLLLLAALLPAQTRYDLVIKGGHVIDPKNNIDAPMDVAIAQGKVAAVDKDIPASAADRVLNAKGLYVTPGLIDIHVHVYSNTGLPRVYTGDLSVPPDAFSYRTGVTTMVDAGSSGWRNFEDFRTRVINRAKTRVLAFVNIVGGGMGPDGESNPADMNAEELAKVAKKHSDVVVGFKTAHYAGEGWHAVEGAVAAGNIAKLPVMVDFGTLKDGRNINTLFLDKLRPGDIYTHCYSGLRDEVVDGKLNPAMVAGRKRGILFDVGHGGGSFFWNIVVPAFEAKFWPDSISTDLHAGSMNSGMKDMPTTMSKMLLMGVPLPDVIRMSTWAPAQEIHRTELGHLTVGAEADVAVLRLEKGDFGLLDSAGAVMKAKQKLIAEATIHKGTVVYDLNGVAAPDWKSFDYTRRGRRR